MSISNMVLQQAEHRFRRAHHRAILNTIYGVFRRKPAQLLPLAEVLARVLVRSRHDLGVQTIPIAQIVGSEGRTNDFDRQFKPRSTRTKDRWKSLVLASYQGRALPAIEVYKLGAMYFVRDGNHRVSVAREQGQAHIEAHVVELKTDVLLNPEITINDLTYVEEQNDFWEWTNLAQVRQAIPIKVTALGGYLDLVVHINQHIRYLQRECSCNIERDHAIALWYDDVYLPVVTHIRQSRVLGHLRHKTEADAFLAVLQHQAARRVEGVEINIMQAAEEFVAAHTKPGLMRQMVSRLR